MPHKDPPPDDAAPPTSGAVEAASVTVKPDAAWAKVLATTRPAETEIAWSDDGEPPATLRTGAASAASAFDRITMAPAEPESDYVARMMSGAVESSTNAAATDTRKTAPAPGSPALALNATLGEALDLVGVRAASVRPGPIAVATLRDIRDRVDVGDFSGALNAAEGVLEHDPANADAVVYAEHCRGKLKQMYIARLGDFRRTPRVNTTPEQLRWLALDHRAGFLLSLVDGRSTLDEVLDMSGMAELDALRLLIQLLQQNVLKVD